MVSYYRCSHCRGFYETDLGHCKYCRYTIVVVGADGKPRVFADREACRAVQIAEYEQLPPEAMADCFKPPADELAELCGCLHCGPRGPVFEAVEMRWMVNEGMWACPCTTCGGRGFTFDIHPISPRWECSHCHHKWKPPGDNFKQSNCKCPKCGSPDANGMFDDEYSDEEIEAMSDAEYEEYFGISRDEEARRDEEWGKTHPLPVTPPEEEELPWEDEAATIAEITSYDPEKRLAEDGADEEDGPASRHPDDIDFPYERPERRGESGGASGREDDIPF